MHSVTGFPLEAVRLLQPFSSTNAMSGGGGAPTKSGIWTRIFSKTHWPVRVSFAKLKFTPVRNFSMCSLRGSFIFMCNPVMPQKQSNKLPLLPVHFGQGGVRGECHDIEQRWPGELLGAAITPCHPHQGGSNHCGKDSLPEPSSTRWPATLHQFRMKNQNST